MDKQKIIKIPNYKIKINKNIKTQLLNNDYYRDGIKRVHINQCPVCGHTNINMDPWILVCVGPSYLYLRRNNADRKVTNNFFNKYQDYFNRWAKNEAFHQPTEMHHKIVLKVNANRIRINI